LFHLKISGKPLKESLTEADKQHRIVMINLRWPQ
jgi:hypothetical protein